MPQITQSAFVAGNAVVGIVPAQHPVQTGMLISDRPMAHPPAGLVNRSQSARESILGCPQSHHRLAVVQATPVMGESEEAECHRQLVMPADPERTPEAKIHQLRLLQVQFQTKAAQSPSQCCESSFGVLRLKENHHEIIAVPDQRRGPSQPWLHLLAKPFIQYVVQIDVGQQG